MDFPAQTQTNSHLIGQLPSEHREHELVGRQLDFPSPFIPNLCILAKGFQSAIPNGTAKPDPDPNTEP